MNVNPKKTSILAAACLAALGMGATGTANAAAYALSYNDISNFSVTFSDVPAVTISTITEDSRSSATLTGFVGQSNLDTVVVAPPISQVPAPADTAPSSLGTAAGTPNNTWAPLGQAGNYARGDAQIVTRQDGAGNTVRAINIAEGYVESPPTPNVGGGLGQNGSSTTFRFSTAVAQTITFDFDADPFMYTVVNGVGGTGELARATLAMSITILDPLNNVIFSWAPNGVAGGIIGGTEVTDEANLNQAQTSTIIGEAPKVFDPTGDASFGPALPPSVRNFLAITDLLPALGAGEFYTLTLNATETITVRNVQGVPEIDAVAGTGALTLLGGALVLAGERRRRRG